MFRNRHIQIRVAKDDGTTEQPEIHIPEIDLDKLEAIAENLLKKTTLAIGTLIVVTSVVKTTGEVIVKVVK